MGRPDFGRPAAYPAPPLAHVLYDDEVDADVDVVNGDLTEVVDNGLPVEPVVKP